MKSKNQKLFKSIVGFLLIFNQLLVQPLLPVWIGLSFTPSVSAQSPTESITSSQVTESTPTTEISISLTPIPTPLEVSIYPTPSVLTETTPTPLISLESATKTPNPTQTLTNTPTDKKDFEQTTSPITYTLMLKSGKRAVYHPKENAGNEIEKYQNRFTRVFEVDKNEAKDKLSASESKLLENSKPEKVLRFELYPVPVNEQFEGKWEPIDTNFVVDETDSFKYKNTFGPYTFRAANKLTGGVSFTDENGKTCRYGLHTLDEKTPNDSEGKIEGNILTYPNIAKGMDLVFTLSNTGVKTEVVVAAGADRPREYEFATLDCDDNIDFLPPTAMSGDKVVDLAVSSHSEVVKIEKIEDRLFLDKKLSEEVKSVEIVQIEVPESVVKDESSVLRVDPSLGSWMNTTFVAKDVTTPLYSLSDYAIGKVNGYTDARAFLWFNRDSIPWGAGIDVIGGYLSLYRTKTTKDSIVEVFATKIGDGINANVQTKISNFVATSTYPGVGSALPDLITIGSTGAKSELPADVVGVPRLISGYGETPAWVRVHVPSWMIQRWRYSASGGWMGDEGVMLKMRNDAGIAFKGAYNNTNTIPSMVVYASSDSKRTNYNQNPTIPKLMMPESGTMIAPDDGVRCDESVTPAKGLCRSSLKYPLVVDAGDPDGWGDGDILGVDFSLRGASNTSGFVNGTSPGITYLAEIKDGETWWKAQSKDRTARVSGWSPEFKILHDSTPPNVVVVKPLSAWTNTNDIEIRPEKTTDNLSTQAEIAYKWRYRLQGGEWFEGIWQIDNPLLQIGKNGFDGKAGTSDDLLDGKIEFQMKAKDKAGNISAWSEAITTNIDTTTPVSSNYQHPDRVGMKKSGKLSVDYADNASQKAKLVIRRTGKNAIVVSPTPTPTATATPTPTPVYPPTVINLSSQGVGGKAFYNHIANIGGSKQMFTTHYYSRFVSQMDLTTMKVIKIYAIGGSGSYAVNLTDDGKYVWANTHDGYLTAIDPISQTIVKTIYTGTNSSHHALGLAWDGNNLWQSFAYVPYVHKYDSAGKLICYTLLTNAGMVGYKLVSTGGYIYALNKGAGQVYKIAPNCQITASVSGLSSPFGATVLRDELLVTNYDGSKITRHSLASLAKLGEIPTQAGPFSIGVVGEKLFVGNLVVPGTVGIWNKNSYTNYEYLPTNSDTAHYSIAGDGRFAYFTSLNTNSVIRYDSLYKNKNEPTPTISPSPTRTPSPTPTPDINIVKTFEIELSQNSGKVEFDWDGTDEAGVVLPDGTYGVAIAVADKASNEGKTSEDTIIVDNTPAGLIISSPRDGGWISADNFSLRGQAAVPHREGAEDSDVKACQYQLNGNEWVDFDCSQNPHIFDVLVSGLREGENSISVRTLDETNNEFLTNFSIHRDAVKPAIFEVYPVGYIGSATPRITFRAFDYESGLDISQRKGWKLSITTPSGIEKLVINDGVVVDGSLVGELNCTGEMSLGVVNDKDSFTQISCSLPINNALGVDGGYKLKLEISDIAGNIEASESDFVVDTVAQLQVTSPIQGSASIEPVITVNGKAEKGGRITINHLGKNVSAVFYADADFTQVEDSEGLLATSPVISCESGESMCDFSAEVKADYLLDGEDRLNSLEISLLDYAGNIATVTRDVTVNPTRFALSVFADTNYFSPDGDGRSDGVNFSPHLMIADGLGGVVKLKSWELIIGKNEAGVMGEVVRTLRGDTDLPSIIAWDGRKDDITLDALVLKGGYIDDGDYLYVLRVETESGYVREVPIPDVPLHARTSVDDEVVITSPVSDFLTTRGVVTLAGLAPKPGLFTLLINGLEQTTYAVKVNVCIDKVLVPDNDTCDQKLTLPVDRQGRFSTLLPLNLSEGENRGVFAITATATDEAGNTTPLSNRVMIRRENGEVFDSVAVIPALIGVTKSAEWDSFVSETKNINSVKKVLLKTHVQYGTRALQISYAPLTNTETLDVPDKTYIGFFNDTKENSARFNPDSDETIKKNWGRETAIYLSDGVNLGTLGVGEEVCEKEAGCDWWSYLPIAPTQGGVYEVFFTALKGEEVVTTSTTFRVDNTAPTSPVIIYTERYFDDKWVKLNESEGNLYTNSTLLRLRGAGEVGANVELLYREKGSTEWIVGHLCHPEPVEGSVSCLTPLDSSFIIPDSGVFEIFWDQILSENGVLKSYELALRSFETDADGNRYGQSAIDLQNLTNLIYDTKGARLTLVSLTTLAPDAIAGYSPSGGLVRYGFKTDKNIVSATLTKLDGFVKNLSGLDLRSWWGEVTLEKITEGFYSPVISMLDIAGNLTRIDANEFLAKWLSENAGQVNPEQSRGDFRARIDNTPPLLSLMPFTLWGEGGKKAADTPLSTDSIYIGKLNQGFVSRNSQIKLKVAAERGARVQFFANGNSLGELVPVSDSNCAIPAEGISSTEIDLLGNSVPMPTSDKVTTDGLVTRYATLCEVSTLYTFVGDGKASGSGGEPQEGYYFQVRVIDNAGNKSSLSPATYVNHDTTTPREPDIIVFQDDLGVKGEQYADYRLEMISPNGTITSQIEGILDGNGDSSELIRKIFTDEYGIYKIKVTTYDSPGNKSEKIREIERSYENDNPNDFGGGGGDPNQEGTLGVSELTVSVNGDGSIEISNEKLASPAVRKAILTDSDSKLDLEGKMVAKGDKVKIKVKLTPSAVEKKIINNHCRNFSIFSMIFSGGKFRCITNFSLLYKLGIYKTNYEYLGNFESTKTKVLEALENEIYSFENTSNFAKNDISITNKDQIYLYSSASINVDLGKIVSSNNILIKRVLKSDKVKINPLMESSFEGNDNIPQGLPLKAGTSFSVGHGASKLLSTHNISKLSAVSTVDIIVPVGSEVIAPMDGYLWYGRYATRKFQSTSRGNPRNYGLEYESCVNTNDDEDYNGNDFGDFGCYIIIVNPLSKYMIVLAHLNQNTASLSLYKGYLSSNGFMDANNDIRSYIEVKKNTIIGYSGNSGKSSNPHIHYEIRNSMSKSSEITPKLYYSGIYLSSDFDKANLIMSKLTGIDISRFSSFK